MTHEQKVQVVLEWMRTLSWKERREFFEKLRSEYCLECGIDDPQCRCWDDS